LLLSCDFMYVSVCTQLIEINSQYTHGCCLIDVTNFLHIHICNGAGEGWAGSDGEWGYGEPGHIRPGASTSGQ
jgi:hypothetical protein